MRLFFAVALEESGRRVLDAAAARLRACAPQARWSAPSSMHLTLAFLGEVEPGRARAARAAAQRVAAAQGCFDMDFSGLDAFPSWKSPRVLWAGVSRGAREFARLAGALRAQLILEGFSLEERPFVPHFTLARLRSDGAQAAALESAARECSEALQRSAAAMRVREFILFESRLEPKGARHEILCVRRLGGANPSEGESAGSGGSSAREFLP